MPEYSGSRTEVWGIYGSILLLNHLEGSEPPEGFLEIGAQGAPQGLSIPPSFSKRMIFERYWDSFPSGLQGDDPFADLIDEICGAAFSSGGAQTVMLSRSAGRRSEFRS